MDVTLALGGGGVRGYAHLGVLRSLEKNGFRIMGIAGTSAGGLFGAIHAAGYRLDNMGDLIATIDQSKFYTRSPGDGPSLLGVGGLTRVLADMLGDLTFDDLPFPMAMTAVDLESGELVVMDRGRLLDAVLATIALPGIFPTREWNGRTLVDGGVVDPVPAGLARSLAPGLPVIAVVLTPRTRAWNGHKDPPYFLNSVPFINRLYRLRFAQSLSIFMRSVDIATCMLADMRLEIDRPEAVIRPDVQHLSLVAQVDILNVIKLGEEAAELALPQLQPKNTWMQRLSYFVPWIKSNGRRSPYRV